MLGTFPLYYFMPGILEWSIIPLPNSLSYKETLLCILFNNTLAFLKEPILSK